MKLKKWKNSYDTIFLNFLNMNENFINRRPIRISVLANLKIISTDLYLEGKILFTPLKKRSAPQRKKWKWPAINPPLVRNILINIINTDINSPSIFFNLITHRTKFKKC